MTTSSELPHELRDLIFEHLGVQDLVEARRSENRLSPGLRQHFGRKLAACNALGECRRVYHSLFRDVAAVLLV